MRILIVKHSDLATLYHLILSGLGYTNVTEITSGEELIELLDEEHFELDKIDLVFVERSKKSIEFLKVLQTTLRPGAPTILFDKTGSGGRAMAYGVDVHMSDLPTRTALRSAINRVMLGAYT